MVLPADHLILNSPSQVLANGLFSVSVDAVNSDGITDPLYQGSAALSQSIGLASGQLSGVLVGPIVNGVATFSNLSLSKTGPYTLVAATPSDLVAATASVSVLAAPQFKVTLAPVTPGQTSAGQSFNVTISALLNGKLDPGYGGTVLLTSSDPQVAPNHLTFSSSDGGTQTFTLTLKTPGKQTVTVVDTSLPSVKGTSNAVNVTGSLPVFIDHFTITGLPASDVTGSAHTVTITAVNAGGKTVTTYTGPVHLTSSDPAFTPFDVNFSSASKGVMKTTVTLTSLGTQSLTATDGNGITGTESNITVFAPLSVTASATNITAGGTVTITARGVTAANLTDPVFADALQVTTSDPHATVTAQPMAGGMQTFTILFTTAGTQTVKVTDLTQPSLTSSSPSIRVSAASATQLSVTGFPLFAVAGTSEPFSVTAEDVYGNPVLSGFSDTITTAGQTYTFKSKDHGTHVFTTALSSPGARTLTAIDTSNANVKMGSEGNLTAVSATTSIITDPTDSTNTALVVIAPAGGTVVITPANAAGTSVMVSVSVKGKPVTSGPFAPTGHIIVCGQGGTDVIKEVANSQGATVAIPAILLGGSGTNTLSVVGSSANNVLVGGAGKDVLSGGTGRDILMGGGGADALTAGTGGEVLIGGSTVYDANLVALTALLAEWGSGDNYQTRVNDLFGTGTGGQNGSTLLDATTIINDAAIHSLVGGSGMDWFWLEAGTDKISGVAAGEVVSVG